MNSFIFRRIIILVSSITFLLIFFSLLILNIEQAKNNIIKLDNQYTKNHVSFFFGHKSNNQNIVNFIKKLESEENIIIKYCWQNGFDAEYPSEGLYYNGDINNEYNLLWGRFLTKKDLKSKNKITVIGKEIENLVIQKGNKKYIKRGLELYEVVGIIGEKGVSNYYDKLIIYNLNSILNNQEIFVGSGMWVADSLTLSKANLEHKVGELSNKFEKNPDEMYIPKNNENSKPNYFGIAVNNTKTIINIYIVAIICLLISLIKTIMCLINSTSMYIRNRKKYSIKSRTIFVGILIKCFFISVVSFFLSLIVIYNVSFLNITGFQFSFTQVILSLIFLVLLNFIVITILIFRSNRIEINFSLEEKKNVC